MQNGRIYRKGQSWILDYAGKELRDGVPTWAKRSKKLAPVCDDYRTPPRANKTGRQVEIQLSNHWPDGVVCNAV